MHSTAPLEKLYISELNVRKTNRATDIDIMAANLEAEGLKQNLDVVEEDLAGMYGVTDGGRRLLALQLLDREGRWPASIDREAIPILIEPRELGRATSMSANTQRVAMNPVDEYQGFRDIIADYAAVGVTDPHERVARCAQHFGHPVRYIEQVLRLADLAPDILEALRSGAISIDAAKAYASVADQALQMQVFAGQEIAGGHGNRHSPHAIRAAFAGKIYKRGDRQVRYIGIDAYLAAGGRVELDLFMGAGDEEVLLDTDLVDRLCAEKARQEAEELGKAAGHAGGLVKPWGPGSYHALPKHPAGFEPAFNLRPQLDRDQVGDTIAIFEVARDGSGLEILDTVFRKAPRKAESPEAQGSESEVERLARIRRQAILARALYLALPPFSGTPFEGRAFRPPEHVNRLEAIQQEEDGSFLVAVLVRIPREEVDLVMTAAERQLDQEEVARDEARPGAAAERPELVGEAVE